MRLLDENGNIVADDDDANHNDQDNCYGSKLHLTLKQETMSYDSEPTKNKLEWIFQKAQEPSVGQPRDTPSNNHNHNLDYDDIDYYDDDYNDDYDYYLNNDDDDYNSGYDDNGPCDHDDGATAIYHYDDNINDYNPGTDDDDNYFVHFAAHHEHYVIDNDDDDPAADDYAAADNIDINIYYYEYDDGPAYDHDDPATYYDYNFNYRGPYHDPPNDNPATLF